MRAERAFFAILIGGLVLTLVTVSGAQVDGRRIEDVVKKSVLTPEDMQASVQRIMRRFYGPRHLLALAIHVIAFPAIVLWLDNIGAGWQRWYRRWIVNVYRSGGWLLLRKWVAAFRKDGFLSKLAEAKRNCAPTDGHGSYSR